MKSYERLRGSREYASSNAPLQRKDTQGSNSGLGGKEVANKEQLKYYISDLKKVAQTNKHKRLYNGQ